MVDKGGILYYTINIFSREARQMSITVRGGNRKMKEDAQRCAEFAAVKLMGPRLARNCDITIRLKQKNMGNDYGTCIWEDDNVSPREFTIEVYSNMRKRRIMETICHEMVHVKQYARNEMKDMANSSSKTRWKGVDVDRDVVDYYELPWEIEAHGRELGLFIRWIESEKRGKEKWTHDL